MADRDIFIPQVFVPTAAATPVDNMDPGIPTNSTSISPSTVDALCRKGFPLGLAKELGNTKATYPLRFWIVDNSGSMMTLDGRELRAQESDASKLKLEPCTRWKELQNTVEYHISSAHLLGSHTIFRLLNDPGYQVGPQEFCVADPELANKGSESVQQALRVIQNTIPKGVTPLTQHLYVIADRIQEVQAALSHQSQKAVVVIATDGLPTDHQGKKSEEAREQFVTALKELLTLPVWVVFRLCTDEDEVVSFYNGLDRMLESPLEVIDDFLGEAQEIYKANKWLNYTLPLHRCREMGYHNRVLDFLDEKPFTADELRKFLILIFGFRNLPDPNEDWTTFEKVIQVAVDQQPNEWNTVTKRQEPWINMKELRKEYAPKRGVFRGLSQRLSSKTFQSV